MNVRYMAALITWMGWSLSGFGRSPEPVDYLKGVGLSEGKTPATFEAMGDDAADFIIGLGYNKVDVLGFSIGGAVAQTLTLRHPGLVHKLILAGTAPKGGARINERDPKILEIMAHPRSEAQVFLFGYLQKITMPVLVTNGSDDIMMFPVNSVTLNRHLPDARLILYPNSAHGFLFQYPVQFARDAGDFLDNDLK